jgi:hyperosmotically inducible protein
MKARKMIFSVLPLLVAGMLSSCSSDKSPDVRDNIRKSLDQAGFKDVSVSEDRDKGVVTLTGTVPTGTDKQQAESIAKSTAPNLVVADQIAVRPPGNESEAKAVDSDLDKAIEKNLDATLIKHRLKKNVKYDVKNGVVTLTGDLPSQSKRQQVEKLAASIPNVRQVVNEIEVKGQKATTSRPTLRSLRRPQFGGTCPFQTGFLFTEAIRWLREATAAAKCCRDALA